MTDVTDHMFWIGLGLLFSFLGLICENKVGECFYAGIATLMFATAINPPTVLGGLLGMYHSF